MKGRAWKGVREKGKTRNQMDYIYVPTTTGNIIVMHWKHVLLKIVGQIRGVFIKAAGEIPHNGLMNWD